MASRSSQPSIESRRSVTGLRTKPFSQVQACRNPRLTCLNHAYLRVAYAGRGTPAERVAVPASASVVRAAQAARMHFLSACINRANIHKADLSGP